MTRRLVLVAATVAVVGLVTVAIVRADAPRAPYTAPVAVTPSSPAPATEPASSVPASAATAPPDTTDTPAPVVGGSASIASTVSDSAAITVAPAPLDHHTVMPVSTVQTRATNHAGQTVYSCTYAWSDGTTETSELAVTAGDGSSAFIPADCSEWTL